MSSTLQHLERAVDDVLRVCTKRLAAFPAVFTEDPFNALDANASLYETVARLHVFQGVKTLLGRGHDIDAVHRTAASRALRHARFPKRSTDPTSNLLDQFVGAAWAEVAEMTGGAS